LSYGQDSELAVRKKHFFGSVQFADADVPNLTSCSCLVQYRNDVPSHHAGNTASCKGWRGDRISKANKHVAHGTADEPTISIEHQALCD
jgi:uncharacterized Fe-S cluster-containing radical SAM superfamily protein